MRLPILAEHLQYEHIYKYWNDVINYADFFQRRFCTISNPTIEYACKLHTDESIQVFYVYDSDKNAIVGEYSLDSFTGKAARVHFSLHPICTFKEGIKFCTEQTDKILNEFVGFDKEPYLDTLFGMTPVTNKTACMFVRFCGFDRVGILPSGMLDRGEVCDALLTVKTHRRKQWEAEERPKAAQA